MAVRCYARNGVRGWTVQEQLDAMETAGKLEDRSRVHQDILPIAKAKQPGRIRPEWLERRNNDLLRATTGRKEEIAVASALVLGINQRDLSNALERAWKRGATVHFVDSGLSFPPNSGHAGANRAMDDWERALGSVRTKPGRTAGYIAAAEKKRDTTARKLKVVKPLWMSTSPDRLSVQEISERAELSPKTIYRAVHERQLPVRPRVKRSKP